ncbi:hypothetical protein FK515_29680, partial [Klebsiella pneumoniae]|nr:hypothetical protein [Klebsiella pneumoniae]
NWPYAWPLEPTGGVKGVGGVVEAFRSSLTLVGSISQIEGERTTQDIFKVRPYVLPFGACLIGRDVLQILGCRLTNLE